MIDAHHYIWWQSDLSWLQWQDYLGKLAVLDNVYAKLSGPGTFVRRVDAELINRVVAATVAIFGSWRCMFVSNFPIEKLWTDCEELVAALKNATKDLSFEDNDNIFSGTA